MRNFEDLNAETRANWTDADWKRHEEISALIDYQVEIIQFAQVVRAARKAQGLSQAELAKRIGMQQSVISKVERASANVTQETEFKLRNALGIVKRYEVIAAA